MEKELKKIEDEILKHKWIMSEEMGKDVGLSQARFDWIINHFKDYVKSHPIIEDKIDKKQ